VHNPELIGSIEADSACISIAAIGEIRKTIDKFPDSGCIATPPDLAE
jgi:hypothetical protein